MVRIATPDDRMLLESLVNHPEVLPHVADDRSPSFDVTPYLGEPHVALIVEGGCFFGVWHGSGRVECHTCFLPEARGRIALTEGRKAIDFMFKQTNCFELVTRVPAINKAAEWYAKKMGFRLRFERPACWLKNGTAHPIRTYALDIDDWIMQGHCVVETTADPVLDCYAGAAGVLIHYGQIEKATFFYNRWALLTGYPTIESVTPEPVQPTEPPRVHRSGATVH